MNVYKDDTKEVENKPKQASPVPGLLRSIGINAVLPVIIYNIVKNTTSVSEMVALIMTGIPSILDSLVGIALRRRIDVIAGFALAVTTLSLVFIVLGGSSEVYLIRNSVILGILGVCILISQLLPKSIMYYSVRQINTGGNAENIARFDEEWRKDKSVRAIIHLLALIWGVGMMLEALLQVGLVHLLSVSIFLLVSPVAQLGFYGLLTLLSFSVIKRSENAKENP